MGRRRPSASAWLIGGGKPFCFRCFGTKLRKPTTRTTAFAIYSATTQGTHRNGWPSLFLAKTISRSRRPDCAGTNGLAPFLDKAVTVPSLAAGVQVRTRPWCRIFSPSIYARTGASPALWPAVSAIHVVLILMQPATSKMRRAAARVAALVCAV